jgi:hypothetical protein
VSETKSSTGLHSSLEAIEGVTSKLPQDFGSIPFLVATEFVEFDLSKQWKERRKVLLY